MKQAHYQGIWPVAPTPFHDNGEVDYEGMKAVIDCMIDQAWMAFVFLPIFPSNS